MGPHNCYDSFNNDVLEANEHYSRHLKRQNDTLYAPNRLASKPSSVALALLSFAALTISSVSQLILTSTIPDPILIKTPLDQKVDTSLCEVSSTLACENPMNHSAYRESGIYCYSSTALSYYRYSLTGTTVIFTVDVDVIFATESGAKTVSLTCSTQTGSCGVQGGTSSDIPRLDSVYQVVQSYIWQSGSLTALSQALIIAGGNPVTNTTDPSALDSWFFIDVNSPEVDLSASTAGQTLYLANCLAPTGVGSDEAADPFPEASRSSWTKLFGAKPSALSITTYSSTNFIVEAEMATSAPPDGILNVAELYLYIPYRNNTSIQW